MAVRHRGVAMEDALRAADEAEEFMTGHEYTVVSDRVLQLAVRSGCTAYDCEFVVLAQDLRARLVTTDRQILRAFPSVATSPRAFAR